MDTVLQAQPGRHAMDSTVCRDMLAYAVARWKLESAMRGVPNDSPRHAAQPWYPDENPQDPS